MILLGTENYSTKNSLSSPAELKEMHGENDFFRMIENKKSKVFDSTIYRNATRQYKALLREKQKQSFRLLSLTRYSNARRRRRERNEHYVLRNSLNTAKGKYLI